MVFESTNPLICRTDKCIDTNPIQLPSGHRFLEVPRGHLCLESPAGANKCLIFNVVIDGFRKGNGFTLKKMHCDSKWRSYPLSWLSWFTYDSSAACFTLLINTHIDVNYSTIPLRKSFKANNTVYSELYNLIRKFTGCYTALKMSFFYLGGHWNHFEYFA